MPKPNLAEMFPGLVNESGDFYIPTTKELGGQQVSAPSRRDTQAENAVTKAVDYLGEAGTTLAGGVAGSRIAKMFPETVIPDLSTNPAVIARDAWLNHQAALNSGIQAHELKADTLKKSYDDLRQIQLMEQAERDKARNLLIEEQIKSKVPNEKVIIVPDQHTRQFQGTGGEAPEDIGTGRSRQTGYQARTSEVAENKALAEARLKALQGQGIIPEGGIGTHFPGFTASSASGVLGPAPMQSEFDIVSRRIIESTIPQEQKIAMLEELYKDAKSNTRGAASSAFSAEKDLLKHLNARNEVIDPLTGAVTSSEKAFQGAGGQAAIEAAQAAAEIPLTRGINAVRKLLGPLGGALSAKDIYQGYQAGKQGNEEMRNLKYMSGAGGALMMYPHPVTVGAGMVLQAPEMAHDYAEAIAPVLKQDPRNAEFFIP
jgi:hypothetical protein